ncbi:hypothetical protein GCM10023211_24890 [Orbus sasakiae]|uniref:CAP-Gly protein n=1 Tax=Orbus sasakiae TaxID=1078475 RepID=A0ABP9NIF8_9GAMM
MVTTNINQYQQKASWGSIIAGVVTVLAVAMLLATLGTAMGFSLIEPLSNDPLSGFGTSFGIWSAVIVIVSLACGGFVGGKLAMRAGMVHGFLVWSVSLICATLVSGMIVGTAVKMVGSAVGAGVSTAGSVTANMSSSIGSGIADLTSNVARQLDKHIDFDRDQAKNKVDQLLRDTEVETLQPQYLDQQMANTKSDIQTALRQLKANPNNYDAIFNNLMDKLNKRVDTMSKGIDKNAAINALVNNTDMSKDEATKTVDGFIQKYQDSITAAKQALNDTQHQLMQLKAETKQMVEDAKVQADKVTNAIAKSALMAFFALLIGAVVSAVFGYLGARCKRDM